jgi:hypothetical protein
MYWVLVIIAYSPLTMMNFSHVATRTTGGFCPASIQSFSAFVATASMADLFFRYRIPDRAR